MDGTVGKWPTRRNKIFRPDFSTARDPRAVRTREALRRALLELLETKSIEQISIRNIASAAGIGYTTFFRHHMTKEALLDELASDETRRLVELTLPVMDVNSTSAAYEALCTYVHKHRALWSTLLTGGAAGILRAEFLRIALAFVAATPSLRDTWPPVELATRLVVSGTIETLAWWLRQDDPLPIRDVVELCLGLVVSPVTKTQQRNRALAKQRQAARKRQRK